MTSLGIILSSEAVEAVEEDEEETAGESPLKPLPELTLGGVNGSVSLVTWYSGVEGYGAVTQIEGPSPMMSR